MMEVNHKPMRAVGRLRVRRVRSGRDSTVHWILSLLLIGALALFVGCSGEPPTAPQASNEEEDSVESLTKRFGDPKRIVRPGESIQEAVDAAPPDAVIHILPGVYRESVTINKPGIKLIGLALPSVPPFRFWFKRFHRGRVIIENPGDAENGILVTEEGDGFVLINVTVRGFNENGVLLEGVEGFLLAFVRAVRNGEYGLFAVHSSRGFILRCVATGHRDTGIYVGQSDHVLVRSSEATRNVIGFEVENSTDIKLFRNRSFGNTAGMLIILLPGLDVKETSDILVSRNIVRRNNVENFADPDELAAAVPQGSGILVIGADDTIVRRNRVHGNNFVGIGVASSLLLAQLAGLPPEKFEDIEPNPDRVEVRNNVVTGNGAAPPELPLDPPVPGVDLFWDGTGTDNCWSGNTFNTSFPEELPPCNN